MEAIFTDFIYSLRHPSAFDIPKMPRKWRIAHKFLSCRYERLEKARDLRQINLLEQLVKKPSL